VLQDLNIPFTQPLAGKLVVEPPPRIEGGKAVVFWPFKERLRIQRRPTRRQQNIHAFKQALADQGHRIPGYCARKPAKALRRWLAEEKRATRARVRQERLWAKQEEDLAEMQGYPDLSGTSFRQIGEDIEAGIKRRGSPRSARVKRLFQRGIRRR